RVAATGATATSPSRSVTSSARGTRAAGSWWRRTVAPTAGARSGRQTWSSMSRTWLRLTWAATGSPPWPPPGGSGPAARTSSSAPMRCSPPARRPGAQPISEPTSSRATILAGGGGSWLQDPSAPLEKLALDLSGASRPRFCYVPTASADGDYGIVRFYETFAHRASVSHLPLFRRQGDVR